MGNENVRISKTHTVWFSFANFSKRLIWFYFGGISLPHELDGYSQWYDGKFITAFSIESCFCFRSKNIQQLDRFTVDQKLTSVCRYCFILNVECWSVYVIWISNKLHKLSSKTKQKRMEPKNCHHTKASAVVNVPVSSVALKRSYPIKWINIYTKYIFAFFTFFVRRTWMIFFLSLSV